MPAKPKAKDIEEYRSKRHFEATPEPPPEEEQARKPAVKAAGKTASKTAVKVAAKSAPKKSSARAPIFVVQKHDASRLHYDFRLEVDGVLASWAVPKGPSMNLGVRHLAVHVEDHPFNYKDFEGNIPEGNYGAGSVIVWDRGTYRNMLADKPASKGRRTMRQAIEAGKLEIELQGEKLKGAFALVRMEDSDDQWLLMKMKDEFAKDGTQEVIKRRTRSVISGKTVEEVAREGDKQGSKGRSAGGS